MDSLNKFISCLLNLSSHRFLDAVDLLLKWKIRTNVISVGAL